MSVSVSTHAACTAPPAALCGGDASACVCVVRQTREQNAMSCKLPEAGGRPHQALAIRVHSASRPSRVYARDSNTLVQTSGTK